MVNMGDYDYHMGHQRGEGSSSFILHQFFKVLFETLDAGQPEAGKILDMRFA
jgi:hypothetical protein